MISAVLKAHAPHIERLLKGALLICLAVPLIVLFDILPYPFVTSKVFFLQIVVSLSAVLYGILVLLEPRKYWPSAGVLRGVVVLYGLVVLLSTFFSVDTARSLWANHARMLGSFALLHYGVLFWILSSVADERFSRVMRRGMLLVITVVAALALLEKAGILFPNKDWQRVGSTVGSPFGLSLLALYGLVLSVLELQKKRILAAFLFIFFLAIVLLTGTRGALVALVFGVLFVGVVYGFRRLLLALSEKKFILLLTMVSLLFVGGLFGGVYISKLSALGQIANAPSVGTGVGDWKIEIEDVARRRLVGYGECSVL